MAQIIKNKNSNTQGKVPLTTDLELGELSINTYDGKIFIKKNNGAESIVEIGTGSGTQVPVGQGVLNVWVYTSTQGQTIFTGSDDNINTLNINGTFVTVFVNGYNILPSEFTFNSSSVTLNTGVDAGLPVVVYNHVLNGPGIGTKSTLPAASLDLFNSIVFEVGNRPYICTANSESPTLDTDCFWVALI